MDWEMVHTWASSTNSWQLSGLVYPSPPSILISHFPQTSLLTETQVVGSLRNLCQLLVYLPETAELKEYRLKGERMLAERQKLGTTRKGS
jgi:hypothetical protein